MTDKLSERMTLDDVMDLLEQIPDQPGYEGDGFLMDLESAIWFLLNEAAKLEMQVPPRPKE